MKTTVKVWMPLMILSLVLIAVACSAQSVTDGEQASDTFPGLVLSTEAQGQEDDGVPTSFEVQVLSTESIHDNLRIADACMYFSWLEFVTPEQLEIARAFLGIPEGVFDDNALLVYAAVTMDRDLLRYYDSIPFEDMPDDPLRIIVRMYEAHVLKNMEYRKEAGVRLGLSEPDCVSRDFGRVITDWR